MSPPTAHPTDAESPPKLWRSSSRRGAPKQRRPAAKAASKPVAQRGQVLTVPPGHFTIGDAARSIGVTPKTLRRWLARVAIAPRKSPFDGRYKLVSQEELQELGRTLIPTADNGKQHSVFGGSEVDTPRTSSSALWPSHVDHDLADLQRRLTTLEERMLAMEHHAYAHSTRPSAAPALTKEESDRNQTSQSPSISDSLDQLDEIIHGLYDLKTKLRQPNSDDAI